MASSDWDEDLTAWHVGWNTAAEIIHGVVRRATDAGVARDDMIIEGQGNEIHGVVTDTGRQRIVRIGRRAGPAFEHDCWPLEAARSAGIPVPEVSIEDTDMDGQHARLPVGGAARGGRRCG